MKRECRYCDCGVMVERSFGYDGKGGETVNYRCNACHHEDREKTQAEKVVPRRKDVKSIPVPDYSDSI